jgi:Predicted glycosylase
MLALFLVLAGCRVQPIDGIEVVDGDPTAPADECDLPCFTVKATGSGVAVSGVKLTLTVDVAGPGDLGASVTTDADGRAEFCPGPGSISPRATKLTVSGGGTSADFALDVRPYGYDYGRDREPGPPEDVQWFPASLDRPDTPVLQPQDGTWYAYQLTSPELHPRTDGDGDLLLFAGTDAYAPIDGKDPYSLGVALLDGRDVTWVSPEPVIAPGDFADWDIDSLNSFTAAAEADDDNSYVAFFHASKGGDYPNVGRAVSTDRGRTWTPDPDTPVLSPADGTRAAHPVVLRSPEGLLELWYLADGGLAYALSDDHGLTFHPWCNNPLPMGGKAPQVVWTGDRYLMSWSTGPGQGRYVIDWAESTDGLRWVTADQPLLQTRDTSWEDKGVANGDIVLGDDGSMRIVYVGVGTSGNGIGIATAQ